MRKLAQDILHMKKKKKQKQNFLAHGFDMDETC
jgi:SOS response regulatory protein OraA/RecX